MEWSTAFCIVGVAWAVAWAVVALEVGDSRAKNKDHGDVCGP